NTATDRGGGITINSAAPILNNVKVSGNKVTADYGAGGGIAMFSSEATIVNSVITGNSSGVMAGGIDVSHDDGRIYPKIVNSLIAAHTSNCSGGGIGVSGAVTLELTNVTVSGNYLSGSGGGGGIFAEQPGSRLIANNTLVWSNGTSNYKGRQPETGSGNNLIEGLSGHNLVFGEPYAGTASDLFRAPVQASSGNPRTDGDYQLSACSPAFNAGNYAKYPTGMATWVADLALAGNPPVTWGRLDIGASNPHELPLPRLVAPKGSVFKIGDKLRLHINFFKPVDVSGTPSIALTVGDLPKNA